MRHSLLPAMIAVIFTSWWGLATAQHHDPKMHGHASSEPSDERTLVQIPPLVARHMLANMRDHLAAIQEIQDAMAKGENSKAAGIAEQRLGMTSLQLHGAHEVGKHMPKGMREAGTGMHQAASRFAIAVQDAGVTGDLKPALQALASVTAQCVGCHAGYRVK